MKYDLHLGLGLLLKEAFFGSEGFVTCRLYDWLHLRIGAGQDKR